MFAFALNYIFIEPLVIPNPCYYHNRDTPALFDLFYDLPAGAGGHPFPTIFNVIFTLTAGVLPGYILARSLNKAAGHKKNQRVAGVTETD
jgi:hypothetical protein